MANPVLVEVLRGALAESAHRGAVAVHDSDGKAVWEIGDTDRPIFPRSAVKAIQALPLVETGAADAYGFGERELALACASHSGEPEHVELARSMLAKAGLDETALECGAHWPSSHDATIALARAGGNPNALHNNCSGKHSGFLCTCRHAGIGHRGYVGAGHKSQEMVREALEAVTGAAHREENRGIDGCSIPTYAVPLKGLALGFARMLTGKGLSPTRATASHRIIDACMAEPWYVAGTGRACTKLMEIAPGRIFAKTGAEGVFCALLPEKGLSIALKCEDGATRAAECMVAALLARYFEPDSAERDALLGLANRTMRNWNGIEVGTVRAAELLTA